MLEQSSQDFQAFLDQNQYTKRGILRYEKVFGRGFISTGGLETTEVSPRRCELSSHLNLLNYFIVLSAVSAVTKSTQSMARYLGLVRCDQ